MDTPDPLRTGRSAFRIAKLSDRLSGRADWLSETPQERLAALELLRQIAYGYDSTAERLQRILEVARL